MNAKNLIILALVTLLMIGLAQWVSDTPEAVKAPEVGTQLFPQLLEQSQAIQRLTVQTGEETFNLVRDGEDWFLEEKSRYPAALEKVRQVLAGLGGLSILEAKTSNPELFPRLQVEAIDAKDAQSILLSLKDKDGKELAALLVGKSQSAKGDRTRNELYVRKPGEQQSWLALGYLPIHSNKSALDWVEKQILDIDSQRMREVSFHYADGETLRIYKELKTDKDWKLADIPEGQKLKGAYLLNGIGATLDGLSLEDVQAAKDFEFSAPSTVRFSTFDGLQVSVKMQEQDDKLHLAFSAAGQPVAEEKAAAEAEDKTAKPEADKVDVVAEAAALNAKLKDWVYVLPNYKAMNLKKRIGELVEAEGEAQPADALAHPGTTDALLQQLQGLGQAR